MNPFLPFMLFAFVASITPGPTNILVLTTSSRYGVLAVLPIVFGACAGAAMIVLLVGMGLGDVLGRYHGVQTALSWTGIAWLTYLAWQIFSSPAAAVESQGAAHSSQPKGPSLGMFGGASLQLVNPKTWMMALAVVSVFAGTDADRTTRVIDLSLAFFLISIPCMSAWAYLGASAAKLCTSARSMQRFNQAMALLLLASTWLTLWV
ncbi:LysE family translocator [Pseudomonas sp. CCI1.2]|uniref:LysE family translocator n=1 Tax=Pseudomonas sp. CCI1.2 TaxID=3048614 RepID=UPI002B22D6E6|nr:LysE family translocator [Pseudomonas sp. CCI1.2]MEB0122121.1 LysE family translocator [Pseudomonas sp. CCI1.2]